ncbi:hypothetical protein HZF02_23760 [Pseudomonas yamanorum]|nr:hypothetical protein HZF02_23760 [Pseudomonas yamanorum]
MNIERVQIEGGFLNGVDLTLSAGLNVLIGARGTGKTSIIELIRYALDVRNMTSESKSRSLDHARAVLEGGEVCITLNDLIENVIVSRGADEDKFRASSTFISPIILSQTEIETVGLSEPGRLSLIDGFISNRNAIKSALAETSNSIRSFYKELEALEKEIISLGEGIEEFQILQDKISQLELEQKKYLGESEEIAVKQLKFGVVSSKLSELGVKDGVLQRFSHTTGSWFQKLESQIFEDFGPEEWDGSPDEDPLSELRGKYSQTIMQLDDALGSFRQMKELAESKLEDIQKSKIELEKESRTIRGELDHNTVGAGALARQITILRANAAQIQSRQKLINERKARLVSLRARRDQKLEELLEIRAGRSVLRKEIVAKLNESLAPWVKVELEGSAQFAEYTRSIANALRGSGMKYNELASNISEKVSPQELMDFVEYNDFESLSQITNIPRERCSRLLGVLAETGISEIVTSEVEDNVKLSLLDGLDYKDVTALSAGQRCTVILSIVLQHRERTLIIDQPEDHLDNSFIANTVIKALVRRKGEGQVILSTHNANIPVLGQADLVIEMTSDGRNGYVQLCKPLDDIEAVEAITNVMEGGAAAFATRARFYAGHG